MALTSVSPPSMHFSFNKRDLPEHSSCSNKISASARTNELFKRGGFTARQPRRLGQTTVGIISWHRAGFCPFLHANRVYGRIQPYFAFERFFLLHHVRIGLSDACIRFLYFYTYNWEPSHIIIEWKRKIRVHGFYSQEKNVGTNDVYIYMDIHTSLLLTYLQID